MQLKIVFDIFLANTKLALFFMNIFLCLFLSVISCLCLITSCDELPDNKSVNYIPAYYYDYLDNRVNIINEAKKESSENIEAFFWITDIHWEPDLNARHSPALIKYIASKIGIDKILNGGDTGNSRVICSNAINRLRDAIGSDRVYTVTGNHEINDASRYEKPFERVHNELRGHNQDIIYGDNNKSYFYFDNNNQKIRYIGLSSFGLYLNNQYKSTYNKEQLDWLNNTALNVDNGWTIVVFTHSLYIVDDVSDKLYKGPTGADAFINAIDNYNGKGTIACVLMGHSHRDRIHIGKSGIPYIVSACDRLSSYYTDNVSDINVKRQLGTISEQHFEVVVIDKKNKQIKLFSIGAEARNGYDDEHGEEVDIRTVTYK